MMSYRIALLLWLLVAGCGGGGSGNGGSNIGVNARVPDVVGQTQAAATTAITNAGLKLGSVTTRASSTVAAGSVVSQNPAAGTAVPPLSVVDLVVASGPPVFDLGDAFPNLSAFDQPLFLTALPAPDIRLVVVEQTGRVKV